VSGGDCNLPCQPTVCVLARASVRLPGFTSVRTKNFDPTLDLGGYAGLTLRVLGDGQRYKCIIRSDTNWDGIAYCRCGALVAASEQSRLAYFLLLSGLVVQPECQAALKSMGFSWSYLACNIGHLVPIWQPVPRRARSTRAICALAR
jgi:Complex I intermediate-associated protein 30 (CIA30)